jgi:predicted Zn-dependent protease
LLEYINSVAANLAPKGLDGPASMQVRLLRNAHLNAFAFPHGAIYLHTGIVAKMENEAH